MKCMQHPEPVSENKPKKVGKNYRTNRKRR